MAASEQVLGVKMPYLPQLLLKRLELKLDKTNGFLQYIQKNY